MVSKSSPMSQTVLDFSEEVPIAQRDSLRLRPWKCSLIYSDAYWQVTSRSLDLEHRGCMGIRSEETEVERWGKAG